MHSIIKQLKTSLEALNVYQTYVDFATLLELKSMPALKILICDEYDKYSHHIDIKNLKQQLPHISINEERYLYIAKPFKRVIGSDNEDLDSGCFDWVWEFRAKEQNLFAKVEDIIDDPYIQQWGESLDESDDSDDSNDE